MAVEMYASAIITFTHNGTLLRSHGEAYLFTDGQRTVGPAGGPDERPDDIMPSPLILGESNEGENEAENR